MSLYCSFKFCVHVIGQNLETNQVTFVFFLFISLPTKWDDVRLLADVVIAKRWLKILAEKPNAGLHRCMNSNISFNNRKMNFLLSFSLTPRYERDCASMHLFWKSLSSSIHTIHSWVSCRNQCTPFKKTSIILEYRNCKSVMSYYKKKIILLKMWSVQFWAFFIVYW